MNLDKRLLRRYVNKFLKKFEGDLRLNIATDEKGNDHDYCEQCQECRKHREGIIQVVKDKFAPLIK